MYKHLLNQYNIIPKGIIHIGAHIGEEIEHYIDIGCKKLIYIEANPEVMAELTDNVSRHLNKIDVKVYNYAITKENGAYPFFVTDNKMSSSLLELGTHQKHYPTVHFEKIIRVNGITFNNFIEKEIINIFDYNILILDVQGTELDILKSADKYLYNFDLIVSEISREEVYKGCCLQKDIEEYLEQCEFKMLDYFENKNKVNDDEYFIRSNYASRI